MRAPLRDRDDVRLVRKFSKVHRGQEMADAPRDVHHASIISAERSRPPRPIRDSEIYMNWYFTDSRFAGARAAEGLEVRPCWFCSEWCTPSCDDLTDLEKIERLFFSSVGLVETYM